MHVLLIGLLSEPNYLVNPIVVIKLFFCKQLTLWLEFDYSRDILENKKD